MSDLQGLILGTLTGTFGTLQQIWPGQDTAGSLWIKSEASYVVELPLIWGEGDKYLVSQSLPGILIHRILYFQWL